MHCRTLYIGPWFWCSFNSFSYLSKPNSDPIVFLLRLSKYSQSFVQITPFGFFSKVTFKSTSQVVFVFGGDHSCRIFYPSRQWDFKEGELLRDFSTAHFFGRKRRLVRGQKRLLKHKNIKLVHFFLGPWLFVCQFLEISNQMELKRQATNL